MSDEEEALKKLLYAIDGMCECYRQENQGDAKNWIRHVDTAYGNYQEIIDR